MMNTLGITAAVASTSKENSIASASLGVRYFPVCEEE
jgi:hypothetical protein